MLCNLLAVTDRPAVVRRQRLDFFSSEIMIMVPSLCYRTRLPLRSLLPTLPLQRRRRLVTQQDHCQQQHRQHQHRQHPQWSLRPLSLDVVMGLFFVPIACVGVLMEAYLRTEIRDAQLAVDCPFMDSNRIIQNHHIATLNHDGIVVIHNAISLERLQAIRNSIGPTNVTLQARYMSSANDADVRQDVIQWVRQSEQQSSPSFNNDDEQHLDYAIALVRGMAHRLEHGGGGGGGGGTDDDDMITARRCRPTTPLSSSLVMTFARHLLVPRDCQLAVYHPVAAAANNNDDEVQHDDDGNDNNTNKKKNGNGYARHLDRCEASIWELGLLEYWRLSDYRARVVTIILYLNDPDRSPVDGGALRYWRQRPPVVQRRSHDTATTTESPGAADDDNDEQGSSIDNDNNTTMIVDDIFPVGGTLVIFDASRIHHQVLPSFGTEPRTALTCWVTGELLLVPGVPTGSSSDDGSR